MTARHKQTLAWAMAACLALAAAFAPGPALAAEQDKDRWAEALAPSNWGGHLRLRGQYSRVDSGTYLQPAESADYYDAFAELRLKSKWDLGDWGYGEVHYEALAGGGDTRRRTQELLGAGQGFAAGLVDAGPLSDDRRVFNLTKQLHSPQGYYLSHRLDRLLAAWQPDWGTVRVGRQALTWGNGLLFNPMDLFNPFSPTDIARDYKVGDDMAWAQVMVGDTGSLQLLGAPRRDDAHDIAWSQSSAAANYTWQPGNTQYTLMAAAHCLDTVAGAGAVGYLGQAAWRVNATYTWQDQGGGFLSAVANLDYSWIWWGKNFYGWVEFYFNGLGADGDYGRELADPAVYDRLARGELYALGRAYLDGQLKVELHPLFTAYVTAIVNTHDPSGIVQPRGVWSTSQNTELIFGASLYWGGSGSEYGGYRLTGGDLETASPDQFYLWFTWYF